MAPEADVRQRLQAQPGRTRRFGPGQERFQAAEVVTVAGYSIETPRLLLHSTSERFPNGLATRTTSWGVGS